MKNGEVLWFQLSRRKRYGIVDKRLFVIQIQMCVVSKSMLIFILYFIKIINTITFNININFNIFKSFIVNFFFKKLNLHNI